MQSIILHFWSTETSGTRTALRVFDALIAILGIICIAVGSYSSASGAIYYTILAVATLWSTLVSVFIHTERTMSPWFAIVLDFALAAVHYVLGIINALAAGDDEYGHGNAIVAVFLLIVGVLHTLFFTLACRDTHVRRTPTIPAAGKNQFVNETV